ncbi:MAG TPA: hypothetical protein PLB99_00705 [Thermotogota bacterium]|nr:hypothetical protein [Thermotogota bacterium]
MNNNVQKIILKLFVNFMITFIFICLGITLINFIIPILIEGTAGLDIEEIKTQLIYTFSLMIYTMMIIFALKSTSTYFDLLSIFSVSRNEIIKSVNITNCILSLSGSIVVNLFLLMVDIPQRIMIFFFTVISLYLIMNFLNFIALIGKIVGWYYVVGSFILLAAFIIAVVNFIGGFILMGLYIPQIAIFLIVACMAFIGINFLLSKKYEYKM